MKGHIEKNLIPPSALWSLLVYLYVSAAVYLPTGTVPLLCDDLSRTLKLDFQKKKRIWNMYQKVNFMHFTRMPDIKHFLYEKPVYFNKVNSIAIPYLQYMKTWNSKKLWKREADHHVCCSRTR